MNKDDAQKKKRNEIPKKSLTNNTAKRAIGLGGSQADFFEQRNALIPNINKEAELDQVRAELAAYSENQDTSDITDIQTNQGEILREVSTLLNENKDHRGVFEAVKTLFSKRDIKWTDQLTKIGLRLIRLYELQRTGTTDVLGFSETQDILKEYGFELLKYYKGQDKQRAIFILKNVENSRAGTVQIGLAELEEVRDMVQSALKDELVSGYQKPLDPQKLEGPQGDMQIVNKDVSPKVVAYLRLYESLSIAIIKQQEITAQKETNLIFERQKAIASLDGLARMPGINISESMRDKFLDKLSVMNFSQIEYFCLKIEHLHTALKQEKADSKSANAEIQSWLSKEFSKEELHKDIRQNRKASAESDAQELTRIQGEINNSNSSFQKAA